jgi:hypothetical protein
MAGFPSFQLPRILFAEEIVALLLAVQHFLALQNFTEDT